MFYAPSDKVHLFSFATKVSIEFPRGWELAEEGERTALYLDGMWEGNPGQTPRVVINVPAQLFSQPDLYEDIARQTLELPHRDLKALAHERMAVDGFPAVVDVFRFDEPELGYPVVQYQVFVQVEQVLHSITGLVPEGHESDYLPVFEAAVASVRFIPLGE